MPGGPIVSGNGGIGASAPKSPWAGIFMTVRVLPIHPFVAHWHSLKAFAAFGGILFG